jgi:hypothetical protein
VPVASAPEPWRSNTNNNGQVGTLPGGVSVIVDERRGKHDHGHGHIHDQEHGHDQRSLEKQETQKNSDQEALLELEGTKGERKMRRRVADTLGQALRAEEDEKVEEAVAAEE